MKKLYVIILFAFVCTIANTQNTFCISINASAGGYKDYGICSVIQSLDSGYVLAGWAQDGVGTFTSWDAYIVKLNSTGILQWQKDFGSIYQVGDHFESVIQTHDGGYIAAGVTIDYGSNASLIYIVKMDNAGNMQWQKTVGGGEASSIIQTSDGGYACVGNFYPTGSGNKFAIIFKLDSIGNTKWSKTVQQFDAQYTGNSIVESKDKGFVITGGRNPNTYPAPAGILVAKFDSMGTKKWSNFIYDTVNSPVTGCSIVKSNDDGYIILGSCYAAGGGGESDGYLFKIDSAGTWKWSKTILHLGVTTGPASPLKNSIIKTKDGGYVLAGIDFGGSNKNIMVKLDSSFTLKWSKIVGSSNINLFSQPIIQTKDGGYASAGVVQHGNSDAYFVKLDSSGNGCCSYGPFATNINITTSTEMSDGGSATYTTSTSANNITGSQGILFNACFPLSVKTYMSCGSSPPCNDTINVNVSNGHWPYTYSWSNGQTTQTATGLCEGTTYTVTVTDASNATLTTTVIPKALTASMTITNATSCSSNNGQITAHVSGGNAPYSYQWSNFVYTANNTSLAQGTYTLTITDAHSCMKTFTATVTCPNGIANYDLQNEFAVYPNPNNGTFTITSQEKEYEIIIFNLIGECIYRQISKSTNQQIDLSEAKNGIYFLNIKTEYGTANKKLIINH